MTGEWQELDYALPLAVWLSRFCGSEASFWDTLNPARLNALCEALATPHDVPKLASPTPPKGQKSLKDVFRGVTL